MKTIALGLCAIAVVASTACAVGPRYTRPAAPAAGGDTFKEVAGWKTAQPNDEGARGAWWDIFGDQRLNALEAQLLASNQDLAAADARFREARALIGVSRAAQSPALALAPAAAFVRNSGNTPLSASTLDTRATGVYTLPLDLSYEVDVWGRIRRGVAAAWDRAQASAGDRAAVLLSLQAELALDYFELRSADAQRRLLDAAVAAFTEALQLTTNRFDGGAAARSDVAQAKTQLEATRVQATDVAVHRARFEHAIAVLAGVPPASLHLAPSPLDATPPDIPPGLPSQLLERRPDIAAAERRAAEANERVGIARASFFPAVILNAAGGVEGNSLANWFAWPSRFWAIGPAAVQTLLDGGRRRAISEAAVAGYDATVAEYRQTTLTAFQQVEDSLAALRALEQEALQQDAATTSAKESLRISNDRYLAGADPYLQVLTAQTIALTNERNDEDISRRRMAATLLLIKALGGGWTTAELPVFGAAAQRFP
ncbi:MAG: efflux system, outer rane lipoprotein NodT family [Acidobacteria bacterium]|nr:efflux system, outer rane lipoprotein NodT family [Acidobacteriota bacterium]